MMKVCILVLIAAVAGGAWAIHIRRKKSTWGTDSAIQYQATRKLVVNHRVIAADLAVPPSLPGDLYWRLPARSALEGHYICCGAIPSGKPVTVAQVRVWPRLDMTKRPFLYSLEGKAQLTDMLDPGVKASIGNVDVEVSAVMCPPGADPSKPPPCYVVLLVPGDKADELWKANPVPPLVPKELKETF
jgi:hypothetical protein